MYYLRIFHLALLWVLSSLDHPLDHVLDFRGRPVLFVHEVPALLLEHPVGLSLDVLWCVGLGLRAKPVLPEQLRDLHRRDLALAPLLEDASDHLLVQVLPHGGAYRLAWPAGTRHMV